MCTQRGVHQKRDAAAKSRRKNVTKTATDNDEGSAPPAPPRKGLRRQQKQDRGTAATMLQKRPAAPACGCGCAKGDEGLEGVRRKARPSSEA